MGHQSSATSPCCVPSRGTTSVSSVLIRWTASSSAHLPHKKFSIPSISAAKTKSKNNRCTQRQSNFVLRYSQGFTECAHFLLFDVRGTVCRQYIKETEGTEGTALQGARP